jgi:ComF family protein
MIGFDLLGHVLFPGQCLMCGGILEDEDPALVCAACVPRPERIERPCSVCGKELLGEMGTCLACRAEDRAFHRQDSLFSYRATAARLIRAFKFEHRRPLAQVFAAVFAERLKECYPGWTIVPVPGGNRRRERGWDPMVEVARVLERKHGITVLELLARSAGASAKSLSTRARRRDVRAQYRVRRFLRRAPRVPDSVVLLDDVFTTGNTLDACARILRTAGVVRVNGLTWARD